MPGSTAGGRSVRLTLVGGFVTGLMACGGSGDPADTAASAFRGPLSASERQLVGAWALASIERRSAEGDSLEAPPAGRVGYLVYDASGHMGVAVMRSDRRTPPAVDGQTAGAASAPFGGYTSYFGRFTVDDAAGTVTHHVTGSLDPHDAGSDRTRAYTLTGDRLTLQPPPDTDGARTSITWVRQPDLPAEETTATHRQIAGAYRIESVSRHTTDGFAVEVDQYESGYLFYTPSGHMSVHMTRPGRAPYAGERPTADETRRLTASYVSYFGPYSVREMAGCITCPGPRDQGYLTHHRVGSVDPRDDGADTRRYYELTDTHLTLRPPVRTDDEGREVVTALRWACLPSR